MKPPINLTITLAVLFLMSCGSGSSDSGEFVEEQESTMENYSVEDAQNEIAEVTDGSIRILENDDLDLFIETIVPMSNEMDQLEGAGNEDEDPSLLEIFQSREVLNIAEKYGWNEDFGRKYMAITMGITFLAMDDQIENMPEDQRQTYKQMISAQYEEYQNMVHKDDLDLLRSRKDELMKVFEMLSEE